MLKKLASSTLAALALSAAAQTAPVIAPLSSHYIVTRLDTRKCMHPVCGGYYVKAVNQGSTRCADGTLQKECHVAVLDTKALAWSDDERDDFGDSWEQGQALVKGALRSVKGPWASKADTLVISEGWVGQAQRKPMGLFYGLKNSGIVCITSPCPTVAEKTLNYPLTQNIHGLDLGASGAKPTQVAAGQQALSSTGVLAAGKHKPLTGPAGHGLQFVATEFYLPFAPAKGD